MTDITGPAIPRTVAIEICRLLGYDAGDVRWIRMHADIVTVSTLRDEWHHHHITDTEKEADE